MAARQRIGFSVSRSALTREDAAGALGFVGDVRARVVEVGRDHVEISPGPKSPSPPCARARFLFGKTALQPPTMAP